MSEHAMTPEAEVRRIDHTATIWFAAALAAGSVIVGAIVLSGWRPTELPAALGAVWWVGAALASIGLAGIGYAGCPVYWGDVATAHRQKSIAIRGGLVLYLLGGFLAIAAMLGD